MPEYPERYCGTEGFDWPIAEAMASKCSLIATCETSMTDVADDVVFYFPHIPIDEIKLLIGPLKQQRSFIKSLSVILPNVRY